MTGWWWLSFAAGDDEGRNLGVVIVPGTSREDAVRAAGRLGLIPAGPPPLHVFAVEYQDAAALQRDSDRFGLEEALDFFRDGDVENGTACMNAADRWLAQARAEPTAAAFTLDGRRWRSLAPLHREIAVVARALVNFRRELARLFPSP